MKYFYVMGLSCTILFICSCKNERNQAMTDFPKTMELEIQRTMDIDSILFRYPYMKIDGDYCCIADYETHEYFFHLFTFPEFKYLKSFGRKGHALSELIMLTDFDFKNGVVSALCGADKAIKFYYALDSVQTDVPIIHYNQSLDFSAISDNGDGNIYTYAMGGQFRILMFDYQGNLLARYLPLPSVKEKDLEFNANYLYQSVIYSTPDYFVSATIAGERIEIMRRSTDSVQVVLGKWGNPVLYKIGTMEMGSHILRYTTYMDLFVQNNIYGLFLGKDVDDKEFYESSIRMFSLNGRPLKKYMIPENVEPTSFYVDEKRNKIYLLVPDSEKPIWVCDM